MARRFFIILVITILYSACRLLINHQELLFAAQDMLVWRNDGTFIADLLQRPFGIIDIAARVLTSTFYYPSVGIFILLILWTASACISKYALRQSAILSLLSIMPIFCLLVSITQMGYWIYFLKASGYWFFFTLLWLWWSLLLLVCFRIKNLYLRTIAILALLSLLTPWNGFGIQLFKPEDHQYVMIPFYVLAIILIIQLILQFVYQKWSIEREFRWGLYLIYILYIGGIGWSTMFDYTNERFVADLRSYRLAEQGDWKGILDLSASMQKQPTRQFVLMKDAALLHTGLLLQDEPTDANIKLQQQVAQSNPCRGTIPKMLNAPQVYMAFSGAPMLYLCFGYVNDAYLWTFEYGVEDGFTSRRLRLLLLCSIANQEWELCNRYIRLLRLCWHQDDFCDAAERIVEHPDLIAEHPLLSAVMKIKQTNNKLHFDDSYVETSLFSDPDSPIIKHSKWHFMGQSKVSTY